MIRAEDVADLREGDVVEIHDRDWPEGTVFRGPLWVSGGELRVGGISVVRWPIKAWAPYSHHSRTLTVVSRAPRPLYVNHPRTEPVPGDVVRDAGVKKSVVSWSWAVGNLGNHGWRYTGSANHWCSSMPARLRLLVDGESGEVVP